MSDPASTPPQSAGDARDAAWVVVPTALSPAELSRFCTDVERLLRINPYLEFKAWRETGPRTYHAEWRNLSNEQDVAVDFEMRPTNDGVTLHYQQGIKRSTTFAVARTAGGSSLTITDDYGKLPAEERERRLQEVDKSLVAWGDALRIYLIRLKRWGWLPLWRWYMRRLWQPAKPSTRRVMWMVFLITAAEFFFFLFVVLIWWIEHR